MSSGDGVSGFCSFFRLCCRFLLLFWCFVVWLLFFVFWFYWVFCLMIVVVLVILFVFIVCRRNVILRIFIMGLVCCCVNCVLCVVWIIVVVVGS